MFPSGASPSRLLEALYVTLDGVCAGEGWYESMKQLHLVSLHCLACRTTATFHVFVSHSSLPRLLAEPASFTKKVKTTRVPHIRARKLKWNLSPLPLVHFGGFTSHVVCLVFGNRSNDAIDHVVWPRTLQRLELGNFLNRSVDAVSFSPVKELDFGEDFDQPIGNVAWPASLRKLTFGLFFNRPIHTASWPPSMKEMELGYCFDRPIEKVRWPSSLERLAFGRAFNQPIGIKWPASLQELTIGGLFDQSIAGVEWPASLQKLTIGGRRVDTR